MSNRIGRFEILSELAKSDRSYGLQSHGHRRRADGGVEGHGLEAFGEQAAAMVESVQEEAAPARCSPVTTLPR